MTKDIKPIKALILFLDNMKKWEGRFSSELFEAADQDRFEDMIEIKAHAKKELENIFERHCLDGKGDRRRLISLSMKEPTTYDPSRDELEVLSESGNKTIIEYNQTSGLKSKLRFELKPDPSGNWKINTATFYDEVHNKWIRWML